MLSVPADLAGSSVSGGEDIRIVIVSAVAALPSAIAADAIKVIPIRFFILSSH
ncbi:hypothetical protein STA1M1_37620 [Sinisalibacter aestuarii]|uniref:Uncharacterized protein n=1 Tax=Sinisalibacter aestuarii TaxID=2949426 RepID=A0ABQ5LYM8_9RHOB|nr:hypothetical protein STA1M1_37620 [Sinisalibacter aestuarii]